MIEQKPQEIDTNIPHRRRGNAFDTLANVMRNVKELIFRNGVVMRNRPSEVSNSKNVFEMYAENDPLDGENLIFIGRSGLLERTDTRNMSYIELTADANTSKTQTNNRNGRILLNISKDKTMDTFARIELLNSGVFIANGTGTRAFIYGEGVADGNDYGGVELAYKNTNTGAVIGLVLDKDGIQMFGLPTSSSGLPAGAIYSDGGTLKIV